MIDDWRILVVDDEAVQRESVALWLREDGYPVDTAASGAEAVERAKAADYALLLVDLQMPPGMDGLETMREVRKVRPEAAFVIVTAYATVDTAVAAIKDGAEDYICKPCNPHEMSLLVERVRRVKMLERENRRLRERLGREFDFEGLVCRSPRMRALADLVRDVAPLRSTVLIQGESGTGKEVVARAIHAASGRAQKPFVAVPCAALAETLLESELFGHERGAFTGAVERRKGKFELADGGTILLDEIGDVSPKLQAELLRVLQERKFWRVGGTTEVETDVRVIAATNRPLRQAVREGRFREDLFYRLNVVAIDVPPLRDRLEDLPFLVRKFVDRISLELDKTVTGVSDGALRFLASHPWPGNVRELENAVERAIVVARGSVLDEACFAFLAPGGAAGAGPCDAVALVPAGMTLRDLEKVAIEAALRRSGGNVKAAAAALGIDRSTFYDKLHRHGIERAPPAAGAE